MIVIVQKFNIYTDTRVPVKYNCKSFWIISQRYRVTLTCNLTVGQ